MISTKPLGPAKKIPTSFNDDRKSLRFTLALPVNVARIGGKAVDLPRRTRNLGVRGAYITVDADLAPESPIGFVVSLDTTQEMRLRCQGRVTRTEKKLAASGHMSVAATVQHSWLIREGKTPARGTLVRRSPCPSN